jgi:hypothetical protein
MRGAPAPKAAMPTEPSRIEAPPAEAPSTLRQPRIPPRLMSRSGASRLSPRPLRPIAPPRPAPPPAAIRNEGALTDVIRGLREAYGDAWSFEIVQHGASGKSIEVVGQLRANGSAVRETAVTSRTPGRSLGELLERAANESLRKCVEALMRTGR